ncbi:Gfo/Idh/MocA family protein [Microlunatus sp. Gsoil 973]|uniref:Gfo/Idh/MocA family protein n=1 Tax=Microlunatus sp. Gsoil 973 TaxID=2672569 RepID=UPI0012B4903F|nr:Gfo/Idh/MocA family oxidoreductase [Microlunatus sp. Gsoil 973]QGN34539.1 gfo/Idh/MocA family oxidoreductase [Microlunatus sp. Gsoil 973]
MTTEAANGSSNGATAPIRSLIIGCGVIGIHHATVLTRHPDFAVTALVDVVPGKAEQVAENVAGEGAERPVVYESIAAALESGSVDLAVVCTPSGFHIDHALEALAAGKHVVVEKPLDVSVAKGRQFAESAAKANAAGQVVSVISQHRFDPGSALVRSSVEEQKFGRITSAVATMAWYRSQGYYDSGDWRGTWALDGGGAVMNQGVHTVDLLRWFCGRPTEIFAHTGQLAHERIEIEDTAVATVRFESGALAVIHMTTAAYPGLTARVQVHGSLGSAIIDNDKLRYYHAGDGEVSDNLREAKTIGNQADQVLAEAAGADEFAGARNQADGFVAGHSRQYDDIAAAITNRTQPLVTVEEALLSLALVRSLYISSTLGQPVVFDDVLNGKYDDLTVAVEPDPAAVSA